MAKHLNVNVAVTADTSAAKAQLQSLQSTLSQLSTSSTNLHLGLNTSDLNKAISDIDKLQAHLKNATNSNGLLDFSKLNNSIKASGSSLTEYGNQLLKLGPQGQQAFNQLTQAIAKSEVPMSRMKGLLGEFGTVLGNTIKWQAASSAIHGMMGSIQHAFSYAQQLNQSLNRIQIVTQASNEHMAQFAEQANKAAKALSTTTTAYTNASLIYYQQGLNDKQVAERTNATIKLANVSGQSAEKVSNQMTAIWNNFDNGTKSLEYYADVITALGAATASSSEEIATGLQKFASVADTVGLSYENATAALATITAQTRQSADTVGTGLRTLFARLQSLNLGETLDDGVTLSKYSKALDTIGVKVIDMSGNLRKADDILMDMGSKWQELSSAQKAAVAQTVGGVRQYTTIMALMDNFDEYLANVKIATNSEGTVQAQADIYAKSWEAAQKRVKAAAESIYSDLIDDKFFISLNNGFADFLDILDQIIDGLGGLRTLIPMIGAALTAAFSDKMTMGLVSVGNTLRSLTPGAARRDRAERDAFLDNAIKIQTGYSSKDYAKLSVDQRQQYDYAKRDLEIQRIYAKNSPYMTDLDRMIAQAAMDKYSNLRNAYTQATSSLSTSQFNQAQARIDMTGFKGTPFDIYTKRNQMGEAGKTALRQAQQYYSMAANNPKSPNGPKYFTDTIYDAYGNAINPNKVWFSNNGQFQKSTYDKMLQESGDVNALTTGINDRQNQINILKDLEASGKGAIGIKELAKAGIFESNAEAAKYLKDKGIFDPSQNKNIDMSALRQEISSLTEDQDQMVTDFAAKWGKSKDAVMKYKDAIVATNGDLKKQEELKNQMDQADKEAEQATKKNQQIQRAQNVVKFAQAMQSAVAAGSSFAAVTENIKTNLENGGSILDNFGSTLSGVTSGFMSMAMTMAAIPGPAGIILAVLSAIIGVASQIPWVTENIHKIFTSEDQLALEQAQEAAKQIQEDFEEAKQKAAEFLDATGTHNGLIEQINQCIRGTEEFKQAVIEANMYAKQMMQDYSLSLDDFQRNKDGALVLKDGVAESRQAALNAQRDNLEIMNAYSQYEVERAKYQKAENKINSTLNGSLTSVYGNGTTKADHKYLDGYEDRTLKSLLNEYIESGDNGTFEDYIKNRGGDTGWLTGYRQFSKQVSNLGYNSVEEYIEAGKQYGSASSLKFDGIVSDLFNNIATSQVFNEDKDLDISSFLSSYLGTAKNGEIIRDASLMDFYSTLKPEQVKQITSELKDQNFDIQTVAANGGGFNALFEEAIFLKEFLKVAGNFDAADLANMDIDELQTRASSFISAQKGLEIFEKNYETLANDAGVKLLAKTGEKKQFEQQTTLQEAQQRVKRLEESGEALSEQDQLLRDYYANWIKEYEQAKETMVQSAVDLFTDDELYKINETDNDKQKAEKQEAQDKLKEALTAIISNSSLTDEEVAEALNLSKQIKNILGEVFDPYQFADFFNDSKKDLTQLYKSIDWTSQVSAFFDVARIKDRIGDSGTEVANEVNSLYDILLDSEHLNGKTGLFSQIFQEEDFQKSLKKVQKEVKKTGKVSTKSLEEITGASEHLSEAFDLNILSAGAVADAIELYSLGAIDSVDLITEQLWKALETANELEDALINSFNYIDSFNPDRSTGDIRDTYIKWGKDFYQQLAGGLTGDERTYQIAEFLGNKNVANNLRSFFFEQETGLADKPEARYAAHKEAYDAYDTMWQTVSKEGNFRAWWEFMLGGKGDSLYGKSTYSKDGKTYEKASEALKEIGFSMGSNNKDVELNVAKGMTTQDYINAIEKSTGMSHDAASAFFMELVGSSEGIRGQLQANELWEGYNSLTSEEDKKTFLRSQANELNIEELVEAFKLLGYTTEEVNDVLKDLGETQKELAEEQAKWIKAFSSEGSEKDRQDLVKDLIEDEKSGFREGSALDVTGSKAALSSKDLTDPQIFQAQVDYIENAGEELTELTATYTDATGATREFTASLSDLGDTPEEQLKNFNKQLEELSTNASTANQNLGKDLFAGFIQGIKELTDGSTEWSQKVREALGLEEGQDFKIELPITFKTDFDPEATSDKGLLHVIEDIRQMQGNGTITITLKMDEGGDLSKLKEAKDSFNEITEKQPITISFSTKDISEEELAKVKEQIAAIENQPAIITVQLGENTLASDVQTLLDSIPNTKNIQITYTLPDGSTITAGSQGLINSIFNPNDQTLAQSQFDASITRYSEYADIGAYQLTPGSEEYWQAYNANYNGTGYSVGSIANGVPTQIITPDMLGEGQTLSDMYEFNGSGVATLSEAGMTLLAASNAQKDAAQKQVEASESNRQAETSASSVTRQGNNKVSINGQTYDLDGTQYSSEQITGIVDKIAQASYTFKDSASSSAERNAAEETIRSLTTELGTLLANIQKDLKPEENKKPSEGKSKDIDDKPTEANKDNTIENVKAEVNEVEVSKNIPPVEIPNANIENAKIPNGESVKVPAEIEPEKDGLLGDGTDIALSVQMNPETDEIDSFVAETPNKTVNLALGANEPGAAVDAIPRSIPISLSVSVSVSASNSFGSSISFAGGGEVLSSALGNAVGKLATDEALSNPSVQAFIDGTRRHYMKGTGDCSYGDDDPSNDIKGAASGTNVYRSYVNGSSNRYSKPGISLTAEEGPEIVWNKQEGYAYIVGGEGHPEFAMLRPGDRIFNANDTRQILNYNRPKSNTTSSVKDPREMSDVLFGSHAVGSAYGSYGPQSVYNRGGRGGGGKASGTKEFKPERYHLITRQIQDLTFWYDELKKARENAYGTNILDSIDKEIAATDELVKANQELLKEVEKYKEQDLAKIAELGIPVEFDEAGNIANFDELQEQYKKKADEEKDEEAQKAWDALTQYEETLDKWQEVKAELSDMLYDYAELRLEKITVKAEMKVDFDDREIKYIQHFIDKIDDNLYKTSDVLKLLGSQITLITHKINTAKQGIDDIFANMTDKNGNKINITYEQWLKMSDAEREALDINGKYGKQLEQFADDILDYIEALEEYKMKGVEEVSAAFDELNDKVNSQIDLFSHYSTMLSSLRDIADLQGLKLPEGFRQSINKLNQSMIQVTKDSIQSYKNDYIGLQKLANDTQNKINETTDESLKKAYQEDLDKIEAKMRSDVENVLQLWQEGLSKARDIFDQEMQWIQEDYEATFSELYNTADLLQSAFDRKKEINDEYVDDYEKYYQLGKLQRSINKDLDNAAINGNKQNKNLKALLEEIQKLQKDGTELSAYDLDILAKKYEYEKALADLEDARTAKQTVRLSRDRNGNWGYVYTAADGDELAEQEQAVEDKLYEYTKAATEQSTNLQSEILKLWSEAGQKIAEMRAAGVSEDVIDDFIADTQTKLDFLMSQLEKTGTDLTFALPKWVKLTNESFNLIGDNFTDTILSLVTGMQTITDTGDTVMDAILTIAEATKEAAEAYNNSIGALNFLVQGNSAGFNEAAESWAKAIVETSAKNVENTKLAVNEMVSMYDQILIKAKEFEEEFEKKYAPIIEQNEKFLADLLNALGVLNGLPNNSTILTGANNAPTNTPMAPQPIDYTTGPYTGVWDPSGKLTFTHNSLDIQSLLHAANILDTLDLQAGALEKGLGQLINPIVKETSQTLEQEVYITAEFPNAVHHSEIEEAFNNLANRATQYANRKVG